jgi:hypothetical protein
MPKKKYSINWENDEPSSFEVDSVSYERLEQVTILYNPGRSLEARIKSFGSSALMWILPGITGILGFAFLGAVFVIRKLMPPTENLQNELV